MFEIVRMFTICPTCKMAVKRKSKNFVISHKKRKFDHSANFRKGSIHDIADNNSTVHESETEDDMISVLSYNSMFNEEVSTILECYPDVICLNNDDVTITIGTDSLNNQNSTKFGEIDCDEISVLSYNENEKLDDDAGVQVNYNYMSDDAYFSCIYDDSDSSYSDDDLYDDSFHDESFDPENFDSNELGDNSFLNEDIRKSSECKIVGNRIVNIANIFEEVKRLNGHSQDCNFNDMVLKKEKKFGYKSYLYFDCTKCGYIGSINTAGSNKNENNLHEPEINYAAVLATMSIGSSFSHLEEFSNVLNIPPMTKTSFFNKESQIKNDIQIALEKNMKEVIEEEIKYSKKDEKGNPLLKCYCDCAWCKRSYRTSYSALSGAASIIGHHTKKVLWIGVANKQCRICNLCEKKEIWPPEHKCNRNYIGPSTGMEPKLLRDGFEECLEKFNIRFSHLIGDGDSSVICDLNNAKLYKNPILQTEKIECVNHMERNTRGSLRALSGKRKLYSFYLTDVVIERMMKDVRCARMHWNESNEPFDAKVINLRKDISNIPSHVFGNHKECANYFCNGPKGNEKNLVTELKANGLFQKIMDCFARARLNAKSLLINENTNVVEQLHSLFTKYNGGKRLHLASSDSFEIRSKMGVLQQNTGRLHSTIFEATGQTVNKLIENMEDRRISHNLYKRTQWPSLKSWITNVSGKPDAFYGSNTRRSPDMKPADYELEKEKFIEDLNERQQQRISIERETTSQRDCDKWKSYRYGLVTASNFGRVCCARSPESYTNIIKYMLYTNLSGLKQIQHGNTYEPDAIRALEELEDVVVKKCGLFIDEIHSCLGATPDGLIGNDAIAEVKCPQSIFGQNIDDAIRAGKCTVWRKSRKTKKKPIPEILGINKNHKWYYQVQGQLHITGRDVCYFVVWTGDNIPIKVEKIFRDDVFWKTKIEPKVLNFFEIALLPELVDSRNSRTMPLRYDRVGNVIN